MYSAVLMLALTAGTDAVDFGNRCARNHGCGTAVGCTTVVGCTTGTGCTTVVGCTSGCTTRRLFHGRGHGCTTGCTSTVVCSTPAPAPAPACTTSCTSSCTKSHGLFHRLRNRCSTSCTSVCSTPAGCGGCAVIVTPATPTTPKAMPPETPAKKKVMSYVPATIVVTLPADARLSVDGAITNSTSERRVFVTPNLENGATYTYTMRAEIVRDGQTVTQSQEVRVVGGQTANVSFQFPAQGVASR